MILEYKFSNYRSIGTTPVTISFEASADKQKPENLIKHENISDAVKGVFIFGNNGTGKTSIISSFERLQHIVFVGLPESNVKRSHALYRNEPCEYETTFVYNEIRYKYTLKHIGSTILEESLHYAPNGRLVVVFERKNEKVSFGPQFEEFNAFFEKIRDRIPVITLAHRERDIEPINNANKFFRTIITFLERRESWDIEQRIGEYLTEDNPGDKQRFLEILSEAQLDITDILVEPYELKPTISLRDEEKREMDFFNDDYREIKRTRYKVSIAHGDKFILPFSNESSGTQHLFRMIIALCRTMDNDMVLLCDEPENSIHPKLMRKIVEIFMSDRNKSSQIFCSTHATELLDLSLLRRDQFYFTSLTDTDRTTQAERLSDRNGIRLTDKVERNFLKGDYSKPQEKIISDNI